MCQPHSPLAWPTVPHCQHPMEKLWSRDSQAVSGSVDTCPIEDCMLVPLGYLVLMRLCCICWKCTNTTEWVMSTMSDFCPCVSSCHDFFSHSLPLTVYSCGLGNSFIKCLKLCQKVQERQGELSQLGRYEKPVAWRTRIKRHKGNHCVIPLSLFGNATLELGLLHTLLRQAPCLFWTLSRWRDLQLLCTPKQSLFSN